MLAILEDGLRKNQVAAKNHCDAIGVYEFDSPTSALPATAASSEVIRKPRLREDSNLVCVFFF